MVNLDPTNFFKRWTEVKTWGGEVQGGLWRLHKSQTICNCIIPFTITTLRFFWNLIFFQVSLFGNTWQLVWSCSFQGLSFYITVGMRLLYLFRLARLAHLSYTTRRRKRYITLSSFWTRNCWWSRVLCGIDDSRFNCRHWLCDRLPSPHCKFHFISSYIFNGSLDKFLHRSNISISYLYNRSWCKLYFVNGNRHKS